MNKQEILIAAGNYIKKGFTGETTGHDFYHIERVVKTARKIASEENADLFIVELAAWLHDVGDYKLHNGMDKSEELIEFVNDRLGHDKRYAIDPTKLEKLGWKPQYTFDTGIEQTIKWYLDNKDWWEQILSGEYKNYFKQQYSI